MPDAEAKKVDYMVMVVSAYARERGIGAPEAFAELSECGGVAALDEFYDVEHTLPLSGTVADLLSMHGRAAA